MRLLAICGVLSVVSANTFLLDYFNTLTYTNTDLNFSSSLPCAGCVRSGFDYCYFDQKCVQKASD